MSNNASVPVTVVFVVVLKLLLLPVVAVHAITDFYLQRLFCFHLVKSSISLYGCSFFLHICICIHAHIAATQILITLAWWLLSTSVTSPVTDQADERYVSPILHTADDGRPHQQVQLVVGIRQRAWRGRYSPISHIVIRPLAGKNELDRSTRTTNNLWMHLLPS